MKNLLTLLLLMAFEYDNTMFIIDGEEEANFKRYNAECLEQNDQLFCLKYWVRDN